jgi:hypothetical protein
MSKTDQIFSVEEQGIRSNRTTVVIFITSLFVVLIFRLIYSTPIEIDGDSIGKWFSAASIARDGKWGIVINNALYSEWGMILESHHYLRWSIMLPQIIVAKILPSRYESYYVLPILLYVVFTVLCMSVFSTSQKNARLSSLFLLGVMLSIDPISHVMASQLKTVAFGLFYFAIGIVSFLHYVKYGRVWWLLLTAVFFFLAYGAHITYITFSLAPMLVLVLHLRRYQASFIFFAILTMLFLAEFFLTGAILGDAESAARIQHIVTGGTYQAVTTPRGSGAELEYADLFRRWKLVPKYNFFVLIGYLLGGSLLALKRMRRSMPIAIWLFFYAAGIYGLAVTFPVVDIEPLRLAMALHNRYLAPFFPLALVFIIWVVWYWSSHKKVIRKTLPIGASTILTIVFFGGSYSYSCIDEVSSAKSLIDMERYYCHSFRYSQNGNIFPAPDAFVFSAQRYYEDFNRDYLTGEISLFGGTRTGILATMIRFSEASATFVPTSKGWYSVDGQDKEWCVMELVNTAETLQQNYRYCAGQEMSREVFN